MAFNFLQSRFEKIAANVKKKTIISEENIKEIVAELKTALIDADVNYDIVNNFIEEVKKKAIGQATEVDRTTSQTFLKILNDELVEVLGSQTKEWKFPKPTTAMVVGLQGSGKTTTVVKIAKYLTTKSDYKKPLLVGLDIYRPAAIDQLEQLAKENRFSFYGDKVEKKAVKISVNAQKVFRKDNHDLVIYDTAGRLQTDEKLMQELKDIKKVIKPKEIIFVADGLSGQEIINVAKEFNDNLKLTSIVITKLDSNTKGGAALSLRALLKIPILFIGTGERIKDLELFHPDRMASRILGLGDIKTLTEKVQEVGDENTQERLFRKILAGRYDLDDLMYSLSQMAKMGSLGSVTKLLPGVKLRKEQIEQAEKRMHYYQILLNSMTLRERRNPKLLRHPKRKERILKGSGRSPQEFNDLLRQFDVSSKQMKEMAKYLKMGKMPNTKGMNFNKFGH